jgi:hypothetical protein
MLTYPQLGTGALSQFPIRTERRARTVMNAALDGSSIKLADAAGATTEWALSYTGLSDAELAALEQFFASAQGTLNGFTFLDPAANLLAWSEAPGQAAWALDPQLSITSGIADPAGGLAAWSLTNSGAGPQTISQTLAAPGGYKYCLSVYLRAAAAATVTMLLGSGQASQAVQTQWNRFVFAGSGDAAAAEICFGLQIPAAAQVEVYGMQAEPQAGASVYQVSTSGGVYQNARLRDDQLAVTTTGVNRHSCTVNIIYVNHL